MSAHGDIGVNVNTEVTDDGYWKYGCAANTNRTSRKLIVIPFKGRLYVRHVLAVDRSGLQAAAGCCMKARTCCCAVALYCH